MWRIDTGFILWTVILVDGGMATGASIRVAKAALRAKKPAQIVVAVPVAAGDTCKAVGELVDRIVCLSTPAPFHSIGKWYEDFCQTTDDEVRGYLEGAKTELESQENGTE